MQSKFYNHYQTVTTDVFWFKYSIKPGNFRCYLMVNSRKKKLLLNTLYYINGNSGKSEALCTSWFSDLYKQCSLGLAVYQIGKSSATAVLHLEIFNSKPTVKKKIIIFRGIYGHTWQIAKRQHPYGSPQIWQHQLFSH